MKQLFRQKVIEKRQERLSGVISLAQPPVLISLTLLLLFIVIASLVFLALGSYTRKESVSGVLQPNTGIIRLRAPQEGMITELLVQEGQAIKKGQPLLRIMTEKYGIQGFELNKELIKQYTQQISILSQQIKTQITLQKLETVTLIDEQSNLKKRLYQLEQQEQVFDTRVKINQQMVKQIVSLAGTGFISELELMKQQDGLLGLQQQVSSIKSERLSINYQLQQNSNKLSQLPIQHTKEKDLLNTQISLLNSQLASTEQQRISEVRSPSDGKITGLLSKLGHSVIIQQNLLSILPDMNFMQAIIYVPTSAFGFIEQGQTIHLRYHAFPYQRFGIHQGKIEQVSSNVIFPNETEIPGLITVPSYRLVVSLQESKVVAYGREHPLRSGMKLDADIVIEQRSLLRWLFDPIFSIKAML
ncbi:MAG: HlyD family efflux transporter periplasmic adaptor subunit [Rickettsiaceae bacterium]|nr:HlyD family efflux transporter periplasmic adaptor subunit [Rickettsiaceae bacterium]